MAQVNSFTIPANQSGTAFRTQANNIFSALASLNAGATAPSSPQAGMLWLDISNAKKHYLKIRNSANNIWGVVCEIDASDGSIKNGYSATEIDELLKNKLNSSEASADPLANKIVRRNGAGYIYAVNFYQSAPHYDQMANSDSCISYRNDDGFIRAMSLGKTREILNVYTKAEVDNLALNAAKTNTQNVFSASQTFNAEIFGSGVSAVNVPGTIVKRDGNGDFEGRWISASHFRLTEGNQDNLAGPNHEILYRFSQNENHVRPMSINKLKEILGLESALGKLQARAGKVDFQKWSQNRTETVPLRVNFSSAFPNAYIFVVAQITVVRYKKDNEPTIDGGSFVITENIDKAGFVFNRRYDSGYAFTVSVSFQAFGY
ncbi:hypothetical protein [uncultured Campylobacter sp.]|uniref:hypothetical protein n=1 Tax=uncultured Campylobacter sp. TaxID=218934 RepID=UPI0025E458AC|nr:hypothetical protein [uncultured Campylobacter sp.]